MTIPGLDAKVSMKNSGVPWLGDIPSHWETCKIKHALKDMDSGGTPETTDASNWAEEGQGHAWVAISDMSGVDLVEHTGKRITDKGMNERRLRVFPKGTLIFSMYASLGHVAQLGVPAAINQALLAMVPQEKMSQNFLRWFLSFMQPRLIEEANTNTQNNLNADKVWNLPCVKLPLDEQKSIVRFLDYKTRKIDMLMAEQERLLVLLKEKRQALIAQVVTKGLNPDIAMKESGVDWIGKVPHHWNINPFSSIASEVKNANTNNVNCNRLSLSYGKILKKSIELNDGLVPNSFEAYNIIQCGDIVLRLIDLQNDKNSLRSAFSNHEGIITSAYTTIRPKNINGKYLSFFIRALDENKIFYTMGGGLRQGLGFSDLKRIAVSVPSIEEQSEIVCFLDKELVKINSLMDEQSKMISLLRERRAALISAAVTGKIDVQAITQDAVT